MKKIIALPLIFLLLACPSMKKAANTQQEKSNLYTTLYTSEYQGREEEGTVVVKNEEDLKALLILVGIEEAPQVDFKENQVVAFFLGTKNTGGYSISIDSVAEQADQILVYKKVETPSGGMVTTALTQPYLIVEFHTTKELIIK